MGDLLMSTPAIRALKESFGSKITVLTSSMAAAIAQLIPEIDELMVYDLPWVKAKETVPPGVLSDIVEEIRERRFDAAVVFTVYSQNPLPTVMLAYLAGIPLRLAYCRENPYELLTHWLPDLEPYTVIKHQVRRDLDLVRLVGAETLNENLSLCVAGQEWDILRQKLLQAGIDPAKPWIIFHPGVSEPKREFPADKWIEAGKELSKDYQLLITGGAGERALAEQLGTGIGQKAFSLAGELRLKEFILLVSKAPLIVSVNTGTIHIAAACGTPVIVLYALTNPQHSPWKVPGKVLTFDVPPHLRSKNEVIRFVNERYFSGSRQMIEPDDIVRAARAVLKGESADIPEIIGPCGLRYQNLNQQDSLSQPRAGEMYSLDLSAERRF